MPLTLMTTNSSLLLFIHSDPRTNELWNENILICWVVSEWAFQAYQAPPFLNHGCMPHNEKALESPLREIANTQ